MMPGRSTNERFGRLSPRISTTTGFGENCRSEETTCLVAVAAEMRRYCLRDFDGFRVANCARCMANSRSAVFETSQKCSRKLEGDSDQPGNAPSASELVSTSVHFLCSFTSAVHGPGWSRTLISSGHRVQVPAPRGTRI